MKTDQLTFNDLPAVVGELATDSKHGKSADEKLSKQHEAKKTRTSHDRRKLAYLKMPLSTFYYKVKKMIFQSSSKENIYTFTGMNWTNGWNPPERIAPQTFEEENEAMLASHRRKPNLKTGNDGEDGRNDTFT